ncbi:three-Cys-motif partner protein TcmP [Halomonas sp. AOP13-D3-9]
MIHEKHNFGGIWTTRKLEIIDKYLRFYSTALKNMPFRKHYIDPFSGTGTVDFDDGLFNSDPIEGSVKRSLMVFPPFDQYHFNEPHPKRNAQLQSIVSEYCKTQVDITSLDANVMINNVCESLGRDRAVFFIDPYGCQLDWESLVKISKGRGNDVWLWFPVSAVIRQAAVNASDIHETWRLRLNKLFGDDSWEKALYDSAEDEHIGCTGSLFDDDPLPNTIRSRQTGTAQLDKYVMSKLKEIFPYVNEKPMAFNNARGSTLFRLYFAMSNADEAAIKLATRGVNSILR